jgi:citrate synthase
VDSDDALRKDYADAGEAMKILKIRQQTLYAYVSRGWIRSIRQSGRKDRLYLRDDLERMAARSLARSGHGAVAASAMNWGEPIIPTSITEITPEGPRYRGRSAVELARMRASFESVAELLWTGLWHEDPPNWKVEKATPELKRLTDSLPALQASDQILEVFALVTLHLGIGRGTVAERIRGGRTLDAARQIIQTLVGCCGLVSSHGRYVPMREGQTIVDGLLQALGVPASAENCEALESILTLLADHELSPGALTARVSASSGGTLHSCVASAICASSGVEIGRLYTRVGDFLDGKSTKGALLQRAIQAQERGVMVPGFVHPLYPRGDPRGIYLLEVARRRAEQSRHHTACLAFAKEMQEQFGLIPRHEFAIVLLSRALGLSKYAPGALFVLARTAGWVAHIQEQRMAGSLLRPRAKFVGAQTGLTL